VWSGKELSANDENMTKGQVGGEKGGTRNMVKFPKEKKGKGKERLLNPANRAKDLQWELG